MRTVTLAQIKADARLYADERPGGDLAFVNEDELTRLVNLALAEEYDLLVRAGGHERYEVVDTSRITVSGTATVDLPDDFLDLLSLYLNWGTRQLERLDALESIDARGDVENMGRWGRDSEKYFRIRGSHGSADVIEFFPTPTAATAIELRYVPVCPVLVAPTDTFDGVNGWEKMIALRVAAEMNVIKDKSPSALLSLYSSEKERVEMYASERTASHPDRVRDVRYTNRPNRRRLGPVPTGST
jgi:hypothetical protein